MTNILDRFDQFLKVNLNYKENGTPVFAMFQEFTKLKWNKNQTLFIKMDTMPSSIIDPFEFVNKANKNYEKGCLFEKI